MTRVKASLRRLDESVLLYLFKYIQAYVFDVDLSRVSSATVSEYFAGQKNKLLRQDAVFTAREVIPTAMGEFKYAILLDRLRYSPGGPLVFRLSIPQQRGGYHTDFLGERLLKTITVRNGLTTSPLLYLGSTINGRITQGSSLSPLLPQELSELGSFVNRVLTESDLDVAV